MAEQLKITDMNVTWRNILDFGPLALEYFHNRRDFETDAKKSAVVPGEQNQLFYLLSKVSRTVCSLINTKNVFLRLFPVEVYQMPNLHRMEVDEIKGKLESAKWRPMELYLLLHSSGVGMVKFATRFEDEMTTKDAVHKVRMGIHTLVLKAPARYWQDSLQEHELKYFKIVEKNDETWTAVCSLRSFCTFVLRDYVRNHLGGDLIGHPFGEVRTEKCISATSIEVYRTNPPCPAVEEFVKVDQYGRDLRGVGSMDLAYQSRADQLVEATFADGLTQDEELRLYLMGQSDFLIFDQAVEKVLEGEQKRLEAQSDFEVFRYIAYHYESLLDWLYIEQFLIRMYDGLLSKSMAQEEILPLEMLSLQKSSMRDLIEYTEGITPYATRADILDRARELYRIPEEQRLLEKKRDMVTEYVMQEYSLRTNRGIQVLNLIISAAIAFELLQLAMQISESKSPTMWSFLSVVVFACLFMAFWGLYSKVVNR